LLAALADDPVDIDTLVARTGIQAHAVTAELTELELAGIVASMPGGRWQRRR
jgi:DNA processing protein